MQGVSGSLKMTHALAGLNSSAAGIPSPKDAKAKEVFQDFVAGTFYKQMFKALRSAQKQPAYFHGGQAEKVFQAQMDQEVAESLAKDHGAAFADPLFAAFSRR
jgi:Rod binding domain-containing protein